VDLYALYPALVDADERADALALARLGWQMFAMISEILLTHSEVSGQLSELRLAARVAAAGEGSPAALALLREVLARNGLLPAVGSTPLQVLSTSAVRQDPGAQATRAAAGSRP